ncbi:tetratricopeptide repeat protein (plasmid) [Streptomyces scopuliridis]|uniref:AfsR/SARP family transcriptional regulator n=1 Tax=Streptomyces scopuliridis TaxID=452529 RepID=UPI002DDB6454|nr:BTAD domain-containing putative transcriptional regulator [Streptomyces scopuliridis]WSB39323.1 tetratricopeptide repeat protein [Streptomyces scopuliridis]
MDYKVSLRFAVLGPVRVWRGDEELPLGSPQQRVVLAALLLRRGRLVTTAEIVHAVWGEDPPAAAVPVLRTYVSRLRKILEPDRVSDESRAVIVSATDGYLARVPEEAVDLGVFEQRVARATKLRAAGELSAASRLLHTSLDEWHETPLAGLSGPLAEAERSRLNEARLSTLETRFDIDVQLGRHDTLIPELRALAGQHPLRERLCHLLMTALYRSGRQAEALACYRKTRNTLVAELGIEPGPSLRRLHHSILTADTSLEYLPSSRQEVDLAHAPAAQPDAHIYRPAQLPADLAIFTGRHTELDQARGLLPKDGGHTEAMTISVVSGMAGIGKTTLAVHLAHEIADGFPDGQLFINLRGFDATGSIVTPEEAIRIFLDALGVPPQRIPTQPEARASLYRTLLADRRMLILLDNARDVEHVRPLLPGSPSCLVIVTSRNQLTSLIANEGAQPLTLHQLTSADAHDFLRLRLGNERVSAHPLAVDEIVTLCARLPLALSVVAARAAINPGFPLSAIADELHDSQGSLDAFVSGDLSTDVRAIFSWSYDALSVPASRLFRLLGLHAGPDISAPAAAALAGLTLRETRGLLAELSRTHLLIEHLPGRYTVHDLLRVYSRERVDTDESQQERDRAAERLLIWYLHTVDAAYPLLAPHRRRILLDPAPAGCRPLAFTAHDQALHWCETEHANLVAAVHQAAASGRSDIAWKLAAGLWGFFYLRSHLHDWLDTSRTALAAARAAHDRRGEAQCLGDVAGALTQFRRFDESIAHYRQEMALRRELGDRYGRMHAVANLGNVYLNSGRLDKAVEYSRRGLVMFQLAGYSWGEAIALANLGDAYQQLGRFDEAKDCLEQSLAVLRTIDNRWVEGVVLDILGTIDHRLHRYDEAVEHYGRALDAHRDVTNEWGEGYTLSNLGDVQLATGEPEAARTSWLKALAIWENFDHPDAEAMRDRLCRLNDRTRAA